MCLLRSFTLPSYCEFGLWQEFLDIPYFWYKGKLTLKKTMQLSIHHILVILAFQNLAQSQFIIWHTIGYLIFHLYINIPYQWLSKEISQIISMFLWTLQFTMPSHLYFMNLQLAHSTITSSIVYSIMVTCHMAVCYGIYIYYLKWRYQLTAFITWKKKGADATEMQRIL